MQQVRTQLLARLQSEARQAATAGNAELADHWADAAAESGADAGGRRGAARRRRSSCGARRRRAHGRAIEALFRQRMAQGQLLEPASDSARYYLEQLAQAEPAGAATIAARTAFETPPAR